ncbi:cytochrome P450 [Streptomyces cyslabdanicus]|uniref:cytochrome P450 n=1 Tax=Streptomyces cyslabdanicus TaxID=1470456 RepID=UPI004043D777
MTEETLVEEAHTQAAPAVRHRPAHDLADVAFDPALCEPVEAGPVTRVELPGAEGRAWLVTRMDDVRAVTDDPRFSREAGTDRQVTRPAPRFVPARGAAGSLDPPGHTRLRRSIAPALTADGVERVRDSARRMLDELVDDLLANGPPADLTAEVLRPFPIALLCELLGVPVADRQGMHVWTRLVLSSAPGTAVGEQAREEMGTYFAELLDARADSAGEDIASLLGTAVARREITLEEAVGLAVLLQTGGEAVTGSSGQMFYLLLTRPELADRLRADPPIRPRAVDELLRCVPQRNGVGLSRIALEDVEIGGVRIRAGEAVHVSYPAANRDPDVFADPGTIDLSRSPNPHVAFGSGPHHCPGDRLARLASELLVDVLLDRMPNLRLAVPKEQVPFSQGALIRGPESLPVTW